MNQNKISLYDLINEELKDLNITSYTSLDSFIFNDDLSADFIKILLQDDDYTLPKEDSEIFQFSKTRARHCVKCTPCQGQF